jgi:hypothetical protein
MKYSAEARLAMMARKPRATRYFMLAIIGARPAGC